MRTLRLTRVASLGLLLALGACSDDGGETSETTPTETGTPTGDGDGDGDSGSSESGTQTDSGDGDGDTGDGDGDTASGDGDGDSASGDGDGDTASGDGDGEPAGECGNGEVEAGEECDEGPDNLETGACLPDCTLNVCGDSFVGPEEGCDDGNTMDGDGCSASCLLEDVDGDAVLCGNKIYECGDTLDNDEDGLIDLADFECISPCDDDESTFKTNLPGQNNDCKGDCYFDDNSGSGDDKCEWNLQCDPENPGAEIGCEYDPNFNMCENMMPQDCLDFCTPLVPNGCDCFGCCEVDGQFVYLDGAQCSIDNLEGCQSCTFFEDCNNPCEPELCELCFGQDPSELPEECGGEPACPEGVTSCTDISDCELGEFCLTGCCVPVTPQ